MLSEKIPESTSLLSWISSWISSWTLSVPLVVFAGPETVVVVVVLVVAAVVVGTVSLPVVALLPV